ncbi:hypothetical protein M8J77_001201 [Diaphorina citri]|nr:hypothetical protein M8J77_001201 [Diaphorina citri]
METDISDRRSHVTTMDTDSTDPQTLIQFLTILLEGIGAVNFHRKNKPWKNTLQEVYCYCQHLIIVVGFLLMHIINTSSRSVRYLPEFIQCLYEDVAAITVYLHIFLLKKKYKQLADLIGTMADSFSNADPVIVLKYERRMRTIFRTCFCGLSILLSVMVVEAFFPLPETELVIRRKVYRTNSDRKLPCNVKIPFVDETEYWTYRGLFALQAYTLFLYIFIAAVSFTSLPILTTKLVGQYTILCQYIDKLGAQHFDSQGREIFYTDLETNKYAYVYLRTIGETRPKVLYNRWVGHMQCQKAGDSKQDDMNLTKREEAIDVESLGHLKSRRALFSKLKSHRIGSSETSDRANTEEACDLESVGQSKAHRPFSKLNNQYQKDYLKQIIKFHQKLLIVQRKLSNFFEPIAFIQTSANFVAIALCSYQLLFSLQILSALRVSKFIFEILVHCGQCYYWCHCSDLLDDCNIAICRSIRNSEWINCDVGTRKDILMLLRMAQRPNFLRFSQGVILLRRDHFLKIVKIAYTFLNSMRTFNDKK